MRSDRDVRTVCSEEVVISTVEAMLDCRCKFTLPVLCTASQGLSGVFRAAELWVITLRDLCVLGDTSSAASLLGTLRDGSTCGEMVLSQQSQQ